MAGDAVFHVQIDPETAAEATRVLQEMGLSVEEVMGGVLTRIAHEKRLPLSPTPETLEALEDFRTGNVTRVNGVEELLAALHADD